MPIRSLDAHVGPINTVLGDVEPTLAPATPQQAQRLDPLQLCVLVTMMLSLPLRPHPRAPLLALAMMLGAPQQQGPDSSALHMTHDRMLTSLSLACKGGGRTETL